MPIFMLITGGHEPALVNKDMGLLGALRGASQLATGKPHCLLGLPPCCVRRGAGFFYGHFVKDFHCHLC